MSLSKRLYGVQGWQGSIKPKQKEKGVQKAKPVSWKALKATIGIDTYASFQPENELFRGDMIGGQIGNERRAPVLMVNMEKTVRNLSKLCRNQKGE